MGPPAPGHRSRRLLVIAFDAAEFAVIERGIVEGRMPAMRHLREHGATVRLRSTADLMVGSVWPGFYSALLPPEHGIFGVLQWRPATMRHVRVDGDEWLRTTPFYRTFGPTGPRVLAIDMPFAPTPQPFAGAELVSWNAHATRAPLGSWPPELARRIRQRHGRPIMRDEIYGPQRPAALVRLRDDLLAATRQQARIILDLLGGQEWDLALASFGAGHRAGHKLYPAGAVLAAAADTDRQAVERALAEVYVACDTAIGEILAAVGSDVTVVVFSPNGMVANTSHYFLLPEMLRRIVEDDASDRTAEAPKARGLADRVREAVPIELRSAVKQRLPVRVQDLLARSWRRAERRNWAKVRALRLIGSDMEGQVQINLRGRELDGTVAPGQEYEALSSKIVDGLRSFVDVDSGTPIVAEVVETAQLWPEAVARRHLPDLVIRWADRSPCGLRAIRSPMFGGFANPYPEAPPDGRSGHHQPVGWATALGPGIANTAIPGERPLHDLTATLYAHFGRSMPAPMRGEPIAAFLAPRGG